MTESPQNTSWTQIRAAAAGQPPERDQFARTYTPVLTAYFRERWRGTAHIAEAEDAIQEVFVDCFKDKGALDRVDPSRPGGFRAFLYGVARKIAQRMERAHALNREHQGSTNFDPNRAAADERTLSRIFDRAWALEIVREAVRRNRDWAAALGPEAERRVEILRLRFTEALPIRDIAARLGIDRVRAHREYSKARKDYRRSLVQVVTERHGGTAEDVERECASLLLLLD